MIAIRDIISHLESIAPPAYQESYDNAGLIVGQADRACTGVITCLDATEAVVEEAIAHQCNLIVAHHPIVFSGLKRFTGRTYVERVVIKAIRHDIAIYAIHTNLDNIYHQGVNSQIAARLGLVNTRILAPKSNLKRATIFCPIANGEALKDALEQVIQGAQTPAQPIRQIGVGSRAEGASLQIDVVFPSHLQGRVQQVLAQFPACDPLFSEVANHNPTTGAGLVGELPKALDEKAFLKLLKTRMQAGCVKYTPLLGQAVQTVALCGGAGGFLLGAAKAAGAQVFITSDYKYHEFFDAENRIVIADIGHYESEQFTIELLATIIKEKFGNFAVRLTAVNTNPVSYL
ncbi:MAG: Nif3-like dinuclear metal center hexameric protein [Saprospiraceae bacterium]